MIEQYPFGSTGHQSTRVIFGAAALSAMKQDKADAILDLLLEYGVNHIDTAAAYGDSELRIGSWMREHRARFSWRPRRGIEPMKARAQALYVHSNA
jgi:aryl-alcohol dehydrogenase-like predicted oxidoreductase